MSQPTTDTIDRVRAILVDALSLEDAPSLDERLGAELMADSLDMLDVVYRLEGGFGIDLERDELHEAAQAGAPADAPADAPPDITVGQLAALVQQKVDAVASGS